MKALILTVCVYILVPTIARSQVKNDFQGAIIKLPTETQIPLHFQKFEYQASNTSIDQRNILQRHAGLAFLSSAILPGTAQAANGKWVRAGAYFATELFSILYYIDRNNTAKRQERNYQKMANSKWSVVAYAQWLVGYYDNNAGISNPRIDELRNMVAGQDPNFGNTQADWSVVDIRLLQQIEKETPLVCGTCSPGNFSHTLPAYGSQQYYELISKYYQFEAGWADFYQQNVAQNNPNYNYQYDLNGSFASPLFIEGANDAKAFNNNYRRAGNILNLLVINHVVSAIDGLFTVKLNNSRLEARTDLLGAETFSVILHF